MYLSYILKYSLLLSFLLSLFGCDSSSKKNSVPSSSEENMAENEESTNNIRVFPLKKTGQNISRNEKGEDVSNGSIKDDGFYQKGLESSYTRDDSTGIVEDHVTGLIWQDNNEAKTVHENWKNAKRYCSTLSLGEKHDWRLPTIIELQSILLDGKFGKYYPPIDTTAFLNYDVSEEFTVGYWSSTTNTKDISTAWLLNSYDGNVEYETKNYFHNIRCVREENTHSRLYTNFNRDKNGVVTDNITSLVWQDNYNNKNVKFLKWIDAIDYCENLSLNGKEDWRLPNKKELLSIVDYGNSNSNLSLYSIFNFYNNDASYWSSTTIGGRNLRTAWTVNFKYGTVNTIYKSRNSNIRCVRAGQ